MLRLYRAAIVPQETKEIKNSSRETSCVDTGRTGRHDIAFVCSALRADLGLFFCWVCRFPGQHHGNRETEQ